MLQVKTRHFNIAPIYPNFSFNGKTYENHPNSVNNHFATTLGDIENKILAVGSLGPANNKVELFDINSNEWTTKTSFPYCSTE